MAGDRSERKWPSLNGHLVLINNNNNSTVVHVNSIPSCVLGSWQHQYTRTVTSQESTLYFKSREIKPKKGFH